MQNYIIDALASLTHDYTHWLCDRRKRWKNRLFVQKSIEKNATKSGIFSTPGQLPIGWTVIADTTLQTITISHKSAFKLPQS